MCPVASCFFALPFRIGNQKSRALCALPNLSNEIEGFNVGYTNWCDRLPCVTASNGDCFVQTL